jgi:chromate reductase
LRKVLEAVNVAVMPQPEVYLGHADKLFDQEGKLIVESTRKFLGGFMSAFATWVEKLAKK